MFDPAQHRMDIYGALSAGAILFVVVATWWWYEVRTYRARSLVAHGRAVLVDVDPPDAFAKAPVREAHHIPFGELPGRLAELGSARRTVVLCGTNLMARLRAARLIRGVGHRVISLGTW